MKLYVYEFGFRRGLIHVNKTLFDRKKRVSERELYIASYLYFSFQRVPGLCRDTVRLCRDTEYSASSLTHINIFTVTLSPPTYSPSYPVGQLILIILIILVNSWDYNNISIGLCLPLRFFAVHFLSLLTSCTQWNAFYYCWRYFRATVFSTYEYVGNYPFITVFSTVSTFIVPEWGIQLAPSQGCLTGPPAYVAWRAGTTTLCQSWIYPPSQGLWILATVHKVIKQIVSKYFIQSELLI